MSTLMKPLSYAQASRGGGAVRPRCSAARSCHGPWHEPPDRDARRGAAVPGLGAGLRV
jgi:hypothetical protein